MTSPLDVRDADRWWGTLPPARRASIWRWITGTPHHDDPDPRQGDLFPTWPGERTGSEQKAN